jgi:hypothetical protein
MSALTAYDAVKADTIPGRAPFNAVVGEEVRLA